MYFSCVFPNAVLLNSAGVKAIIITCALILKKYLKNVMLSTPNYSEGQSFLLIKKVCYRSVLSA